jgi:hypothetical protein
MVIRTHSVEFMPFLLSLFNFLNGLVWFGYAFVGGLDIFIAVSTISIQFFIFFSKVESQIRLKP